MNIQPVLRSHLPMIAEAGNNNVVDEARANILLAGVARRGCRANTEEVWSDDRSVD